MLKFFGFFQWAFTGYSPHFEANGWWRLVAIPAIIILSISLIKMIVRKIIAAKEKYDDNYKYNKSGYYYALDSYFQFPKKLKALLLIYVPMFLLFGLATYLVISACGGAPIPFGRGETVDFFAISLCVIAGVFASIVYFKFGSLDSLMCMPALRNDFKEPAYVTVPYKLERWTGAYNSEWKVTETQTYDLNAAHNEKVAIHNFVTIAMAVVTFLGDLVIFVLFAAIESVLLLMKIPFLPLIKSRIKPAFQKDLALTAKHYDKYMYASGIDRRRGKKEFPYRYWMTNYHLRECFVKSALELERGTDSFMLVATVEDMVKYVAVNVKKKILEVKEGDVTYYIYENDWARIFIILNPNHPVNQFDGMYAVVVPFNNGNWRTGYAYRQRTFEDTIKRWGICEDWTSITQIKGDHGFVEKMQYHYFKKLKDEGRVGNVMFVHYYRNDDPTRVSASIITRSLSSITLDDKNQNYTFEEKFKC